MNLLTNRLHDLSTLELQQFRSIMIDVGLVHYYTGKFRVYLKEELKLTSGKLHRVLCTVHGGSTTALDNIITNILGER